MINAALSNDSVVFDTGTFETLPDALAWSKGRGGKYTVQLSRIYATQELQDERPGASFSYDDDKGFFMYHNGYQWLGICEADIDYLL